MQVESVLNDYVRLVEQESSYQDMPGSFGDDLIDDDDQGLGGAAAAGERSAESCVLGLGWVDK